MPLNITLYALSVWVLPLVIAITFHEAAHGFVAHRLGDNTAYNLGRVSFNPIRHIDPFGTLVMPAILLMAHSPFLFGYAKPVPVSWQNLHHPKRDMMLVAGAGPATNFLLAAAFAAATAGLDVFGVSEPPIWLMDGLAMGVTFNLWIGLFNLIPVPPLDGSKVIAGLLPDSWAARYVGFRRMPRPPKEPPGPVVNL
jgi:Zn-dependent protease